MLPRMGVFDVKRTLILLAVLLILQMMASGVRAQETSSRLDWLTVELWPDYDRPAVLVLLTASLPAEAPLPARVTLPMPEAATVNAVARISGENQMVDDVEYTTGERDLTLVAPERRFRVEYYMPYAEDGLQRDFRFNWQSELSVEEMGVSVQQPRAATSLAVTPQAESVMEGNDGLEYHHLPVQALASGESYAVSVTYTLERARLTQAEEEAAASAATNWPMVLAIVAVLLLLLVAGWQVFGRHHAVKRSELSQPRSLRSVRNSPLRFCHECGERAQEGDRFCRECGTRLREG